MKKIMMKTCKNHGVTEFVLEGRGYYRCKKCRVDAVKRRRRKLKRMSIEHLGGKCKFCGYNKSDSALSFHHLNPDEKDFKLSTNSKSWTKIEKELDKCILLCFNCHMEEHERLRNIGL